MSSKYYSPSANQSHFFEAHRHQQSIARPPTYKHEDEQSREQHQPNSPARSSKQHSNSQVHIKTKLASSDPRIIAQAEAARHQRTLMNIFQVYALLVISLALIYAVYHFCQQSNRQFITSQPQTSGDHSLFSNQLEPLEQALPRSNANSNSDHQASQEISHMSSATLKQQLEFEQKIQLLQRYIELIAVDLRETKDRLKDREKCQCALTCRFNNTSYADGSSWQQQCDTCTCQSGKISCSPFKCPQVNCDDPVQLPAQCCPVCLRRCKYNQMTLRHGQTFKPTDSSKECQCHDGLIKCSTQQRLAKGAASQKKPNSRNRLSATPEGQSNSAVKPEDEPSRGSVKQPAR